VTIGPDHDPQVDLEPTVGGRIARSITRARILRGRVEAARSRHSSIDLCFSLVERDSAVGGGLLAGALAYRLFVLLLPTSVLLVSGLGLYAGTVDKSPKTVTKEAGLTGLIGSQVSEAAAGKARGLIFVLMIPAAIYALVTLFGALTKVHGLAWNGSARGLRVTPAGVATLGGAVVVLLATSEVVSWIRRESRFGVIAALLAYVVLIGAAWLAVSHRLPHRDVKWTALLPGSLLFALGLACVAVFNVYVTTRLVEGRADTYGALGVATALLFSLVLVGRLMVVSAELNASLHERRPARSL
jgi:uncharacterized BrkB/YihY/UPF0761 family membrane protein